MAVFRTIYLVPKMVVACTIHERRSVLCLRHD